MEPAGRGITKMYILAGYDQRQARLFRLAGGNPAHAVERHVNEVVLSFRRIDDIGRMPELRRVPDEMKMAAVQGGADQSDRKVA